MTEAETIAQQKRLPTNLTNLHESDAGWNPIRADSWATQLRPIRVHRRSSAITSSFPAVLGVLASFAVHFFICGPTYDPTSARFARGLFIRAQISIMSRFTTGADAGTRQRQRRQIF
jgi:hypothetical protein